MNFPAVGLAPREIIPEWQTYAREINATRLNINTKYASSYTNHIHQARTAALSSLLAKISE